MRNPKVQSIFLDDMPIHQAAFASGGSHVRLAPYRHHGVAQRAVAGLTADPLEKYKCCVHSLSGHLLSTQLNLMPEYEPRQAFASGRPASWFSEASQRRQSLSMLACNG